MNRGIPSTYVVGDIQGCYVEFRELLGNAGFREGKDALWLVGDLVNRGPDNVATMRYIMSLPRSVVVLGNHDLHFVAVARGHQRAGRADTLADLLDAPDLDDMVDYLVHCPLMHVDEARRYVMAHAGLPPIWTVQDARRHASEVESVLRTDKLDTFLAGMYGNEPARWHDSLSGLSRLRIITNYFTRLRYCTAEGEMELTHKADIEPPGYKPWFTFPRPDQADWTILFGHWAALEGRTGDDRFVALDTGCVWGRELTALRLEDRRIFSVTRRS